jgi:hypothetical protein
MLLCIPQKYFPSMQINILEKIKNLDQFSSFLFHSFLIEERSDNLKTNSVENEGGIATHILFHLHENAFESKKGDH